MLWISVPIGVERVEFNSNRVFDPRTIYNFAAESGIVLEEFSYLINDRIVVSSDYPVDFENLANVAYSLGIFKFRKPAVDL